MTNAELNLIIKNQNELKQYLSVVTSTCFACVGALGCVLKGIATLPSCDEDNAAVLLSAAAECFKVLAKEVVEQRTAGKGL